MNIKTAVILSASLSGAVIGATMALSAKMDRDHERRMNALNEDIEKSRQFRRHLDDTVIPALDEKLEKARFWDIVTRNQ